MILDILSLALRAWGVMLLLGALADRLEYEPLAVGFGTSVLLCALFGLLTWQAPDVD